MEAFKMMRHLVQVLAAQPQSQPLFDHFEFTLKAFADCFFKPEFAAVGASSLKLVCSWHSSASS